MSPPCVDKSVPAEATISFEAKSFNASLVVTARSADKLMLPPYTVMGPAMVCALPIVISAVLPSLPSVRPVSPVPTVKPDSGQLSGLAKLVP